MSYRVEVSEPAERDADRIYLWLRKRSSQGAGRWWTALLAALEKLKQNPVNFSLAPEADDVDEPLRQVLFKTRKGHLYRAIFIVRDDIVHVLRIRGEGQDLVEPTEFELPE